MATNSLCFHLKEISCPVSLNGMYQQPNTYSRIGRLSLCFQGDQQLCISVAWKYWALALLGHKQPYELQLKYLRKLEKPLIPYTNGVKESYATDLDTPGHLVFAKPWQLGALTMIVCMLASLQPPESKIRTSFHKGEAALLEGTPQSFCPWD